MTHLFNNMVPVDDHPQHECGIIGIFAPNQDVARMAFFGLYTLQHRGQEAAGIAVSDGLAIRNVKNLGLVSQVFNEQNLEPLKGHYAIGHTRYSTTGSSSVRNAQPLIIDTRHGPIAVAHNGNLVNAAQLRQDLLHKGIGLTSSSDSEIITMMLAGAEGKDWDERVQKSMPQWIGAYSLVILTLTGVFAIRDPWGFHPLSVGLLPGGGHAAASESGALQILGCEAIREVRPGEIIALSDNALIVHQAVKPKEPLALCTFEQVYFSRPDSIWDGVNVHQVRVRLGKELAAEAPVIDADLVIPVPDSSVPAAIGFSQASGLPYNDGFIKNRYIGRTFIQPTEQLRQQGIALKFNVIKDNIRGKKLVMIDDSIVRGNTTGALVKLLLEAGAIEVHVRITCPTIQHPCFMGVDMGTYDELIAHKLDEEQICKQIGATSLCFLSLDGMMRAIGHADGYCNACFTGHYPIEVNFNQIKTGFENTIV